MTNPVSEQGKIMLVKAPRLVHQHCIHQFYSQT
jgi:hypothetical protein